WHTTQVPDSPEEQQRSNQLHSDIVNAIRSRDPAASEQAMHVHMDALVNALGRAEQARDSASPRGRPLNPYEKAPANSSVQKLGCSGTSAHLPAGIAENAMLTIHDQSYRLCDNINRREWLRAGSLGLLGLSLPALCQGRAAKPVDRNPSAGKAKSCIVLYLGGGPPQHETWDPKPDAPAEIRGDLKPIASSVPGLWVGELMPRVARLADKCCVLRSVFTNDHSHSSSMYWTMTGSP